MKISRVEATYLRDFPIEPPPFRAEPSHGRAILVEVEADGGVTGYGLLSGDRSGESRIGMTVRYVNGAIADLLVGQDATLVEQAWGLMARTLDPGPGGRAISTVDSALWDLKGKALGLPVWRLLGGAQNPVRAYVTFGATGANTGAPDAPPYSHEELVAEAKYHVKYGQTGLKTAVARTPVPNPDEDLRRLAAVREAIGPGVRLMIDALGRLSINDAVRLCRLCEPLDISFFEEPVIDNDPDLLVELSRQTTISLSAGLEVGRWGYRELLTRAAIQIVQPHVGKIGFTESIAVGQLAHTCDRPLSSTSPHLVAGMPNGWAVEYNFRQLRLQEAVLTPVPVPQDGWVHLPETPGFGLDVRAEIMKDYRTVPA